MMNDGMADTFPLTVFNSSFIIHHSSFLNLALPPGRAHDPAR
jgi:hypothetical protein